MSLPVPLGNNSNAGASSQRDLTARVPLGARSRKL